MDQELKAYLDAQKADLDAKFASVGQLIEDTSASLQREIAEVRDTMRGIVIRLDRQAGLIQIGARQTTRFVSWSESVDVTLAEFRDRLQALESRGEKQ
jgi:hypothetical protein